VHKRKRCKKVGIASPAESNLERETPSKLPPDCTNSLPDYTELDPKLKRTTNFVAGKGARSRSKSDDETAEVLSEQSGAVQSCQPPPHLDKPSDDKSISGAAGKQRRNGDGTPSITRTAADSAPTLQSGYTHHAAKKKLPANCKPIDSLEYTAVLSVHVASDKGDCLFDSLTSSLKYLLDHHLDSYNFSRFPQSLKTIRAYCDNQALRDVLVDHLLKTADSPFVNLGGLTPAEAVTRDYIDGQQPLHDSEWYDQLCSQKPAPLISTLPAHQVIRSFHQYAEAMRKPFAHGDEIMLVMFCDLFNLRVVVAELTDKTCSERLEDPTHTLSRTSMDIMPDVPLSSNFVVTLILSGNHYDWAHLSKEACDDVTAHCMMGPAEHVVCCTNAPIVYDERNPDSFTPVCHELIHAHSRKRRRDSVLTCLVDEHGAVPEEAELTISTFERLGGLVSMHTLPELLHLHRATTYKPLSDSTTADSNNTQSSSGGIKRPLPSRHVQSNNVKRASVQRQLNDLIESSDAEEPADLKWAADAVRLVTNCNRDLAVSTVKHNHSKCLDYVQAVAVSCQQISAITGSAAQAPPIKPAQAPQTFNTEVSFIERHLGEGVREMTQAELAAAEKTLVAALTDSTAAMPPMSAIVPRNLSQYWHHHLAAVSTTPRGAMTAEQHARAVRKIASNALHHEACNAASSKLPPTVPLVQTQTATAATPTQQFQTPVQGLQRPLQSSDTTPTQPFTAAAVPALSPTSPAQNYLAHSSPAVRMAASRAAQAQSAKSSATTVVVMASNSSKLLQWKAGSEKDCKGFYWSTKLAVQQAWEQYNTSEDMHSYRTFKSAIHCTMLPIICAELSMSRDQFDKVSDAELIDLIDKKLKPTGPADYLIKMRQIKFDTVEPSSTSLLHRYRAFAEPFLQLLAEATEAGCSINEESVKLAFKEQCRGSNLMMMWLQEDRWTNASAAHQRIMTHLKNFDTLVTLQSLDGRSFPKRPTQEAQPAAAPIIPVALPQQQRSHQQHQATVPAADQAVQQSQPYYTPQQRAEYKRQKALAAQQPLVQAFQPQVPQTSMMPAAQPARSVQQPNPLFHASPQLQANVMVSPPPATVAPYVQPGLDHRGPHWHPIGAKCRFTPCSSPFCQGCGEHGHSAHDCKKRNKHANWNYNGYYADQRPGQGPLIYDGPAKLPQQLPAPATPAAPAPTFPTPYNQAVRPAPPPAANPARTYTPVVRSNVASQHPESSSATAQP
jgi:hypothetical protein